MKTQTTSMQSTRSTLRQTLTMLGTVLLLALGLSACVISPYDDEYIDPDKPVYFEGFSQRPNATIEILAFNYKTNHWEVVATTTSGATSRVFNSNTLYPWNQTVVVRNIPAWECYMKYQTAGGTSCGVPEGRENEIKFYVREVGGLDGLYTFDADGFACLEDQVNNGVGAYTAGVACKSDDNPFLHQKLFPGVVN